MIPSRSRRYRASRLTGIVALAVGLSTLAACAPAEVRPPQLDITSDQEEAQAQLDLQRYADAVLAKYPSADLPEVERIRFILSNEWGATIAGCLTEQGFEATSTPDGGLGSKPIEAQDEPYMVAMYVCNAKYPLDPRTTIPLVDDQVRYLYDYYVHVATPCLEDMGFEVPSPPSLQAYVDGYRQAPSWRPYDDASLMSTPEQWERIQTECPEVPAALYGR